MTECSVCGANGVRPGPCQPWCDGVRAMLRLTLRARSTCGTHSGYRAHYRRGETACADCRLGERQYRRGLTARKAVA